MARQASHPADLRVCSYPPGRAQLRVQDAFTQSIIGTNGKPAHTSAAWTRCFFPTSTGSNPFPLKMLFTGVLGGEKHILHAGIIFAPKTAGLLEQILLTNICILSTDSLAANSKGLLALSSNGLTKTRTLEAEQENSRIRLYIKKSYTMGKIPLNMIKEREYIQTLQFT